MKKESAIVLVIEADGRVLAVTNRKYGGLCLPGGKVEPDEPLKSAARRELLEETAIDVLEEDLVWIASGESPTETGRVVHMFYALAAEGFPHQVEEGTRPSWQTIEAMKESKPFGDYYTKHLPDGVRHLRMTRSRKP